jgi:hypothetical protein
LASVDSEAVALEKEGAPVAVRQVEPENAAVRCQHVDAASGDDVTVVVDLHVVGP